MNPWKVVIADNHPISRAGLKVVLENTRDFVVIGEATSGQQAIKLCQSLQPDIVLMDISMPNGNGIEATSIIHQQFPQIMIIGISGFRHEEMEQAILRAGAIGYISKEADFGEILVMIHVIASGTSLPLTPLKSKFNLTSTELKVLALLAEGHDRQQIAQQLSISYNTVKMHFRNLYQKLGVESAKDAIKMALEHQIL